MPFSCGDEAQKPDLGAGSRAAPGRWDGVTRTPGGQSKHGQGGQISRCMDGTSGNKFPAAEPPSPGLEALDFLSGAFAVLWSFRGFLFCFVLFCFLLPFFSFFFFL